MPQITPSGTVHNLVFSPETQPWWLRIGTTDLPLISHTYQLGVVARHTGVLADITDAVLDPLQARGNQLVPFVPTPDPEMQAMDIHSLLHEQGRDTQAKEMPKGLLPLLFKGFKNHGVGNFEVPGHLQIARLGIRTVGPDEHRSIRRRILLEATFVPINDLTATHTEPFTTPFAWVEVPQSQDSRLTTTLGDDATEGPLTHRINRRLKQTPHIVHTSPLCLSALHATTAHRKFIFEPTVI